MYEVPKVIFIVVCSSLILLFDGHLNKRSFQLRMDASKFPQRSAGLKKSDINVSSIVRRYSHKIQKHRKLDDREKSSAKYYQNLVNEKVELSHQCKKIKKVLIYDALSNDSTNNYKKYTFDYPKSYDGFVVEAWPPSKDRNISNYIRDPFTYLPNKSNFENKKLAIIVQSLPSELDLRMMWRYFVGKYSNSYASIIFLLGKEPTLGSKDKVLLSEERKKYKDIALVEGLVEHYHNLTLKSLYSLKLFLNSAWSPSPPDYMLKIDVDVFVNIPKLFHEVINNSKYENMAHFMVGQCNGCGSNNLLARIIPPPFYNKLSKERQQDIISNTFSKWIIPSYLYNKKSYPTFLSGPAYLMSRSSAECMLQRASDVPYFTLEDVYITGFLAQECAVKRLDHPGFTAIALEFDYETDIINHLDYSKCVYYTGDMKGCSYDRLEIIESIITAKKNC